MRSSVQEHLVKLLDVSDLKVIFTLNTKTSLYNANRWRSAILKIRPHVMSRVPETNVG